MKKLVITLLTLCLVTTVFAFDELWQKAQKISENSWNLVPGKTTQLNKMTDDKKNEMVMDLEVIVLHSLADNGSVLNELVTAKNMGEDLDPDDNKQIEGILSQDKTPSKDGMFFETNPKNLTVNVLRESKNINGKDCQAYSVRYLPDGNKKEALEGKVWLDKKTGAPVLAELTMSKTPMFVKSVDMKTHYLFEQGKVYPDKIEVVMSISALGKKITNETTILMHDYWEYPEN